MHTCMYTYLKAALTDTYVTTTRIKFDKNEQSKASINLERIWDKMSKAKQSTCINSERILLGVQKTMSKAISQLGWLI